ncbi:cytochrome P450 [Lophiostoma macrostomum CBS 122681]|uniref:Cytochrome P450 n=1 Tax=Lophiostoma macrostomum CBS 122681 TaxID=1314788 RepID=A0A6A6TAX6_9PLEO|nr:cytochrome P450 [Lophiostoma macrostomum CBS 122681]
MGTNVLQSPTVVAGLIFVAFIFVAILVRNKRLDAQARRNGFEPPPRYRALDPFTGIDYVIKIFTDVSAMQRNRLQYGKTFIIKTLISPHSIVTSEPDNIQKVFASVDNDYGVYWRREPFVPFTGRGILTEDGDGWRLPRKLYRPSFAKTSIANLEYYSKIVDDTLDKIPGEGETVDLHPILLAAFMNNALHFGLGFDALNPHEETPLSREEFMSIWTDGMQGIGMRLLTGRLNWLLPMTKFKQSCVKVHDFVEFYINKAATTGTKQDKTQVAVSLLEQTEDRTLIRNMLVQGIIGAQDTTSVLTSNTIHLLARHPVFWDELREEVLKRGEELFTFDALRTNEVIQNLLSESLRICPVFPAMDRVATRDTILPTGGGPNSTSPILVKKGTRVQASFYALHREPSVYGADVETFNPHRWKTIKPGQWEFMAFGGGPRNCMGREKSLAEAAYLLAKLARRFEVLESRDKREWTGVLTLTCANKFGCLVAFR